MDHPYSTNFYNSDEKYTGNESNLITGTVQPNDHELLINCIRGYPNIWDQSHRLYKDSEAKAASWADIAKYLDRKVEDLQTSWKSLRKKFISERSAQDKENLNGSTASSRPRWYLYESMLFLKKTIRRRRTRTNFIHRSQPLQGKKYETINSTSPSKSTSDGQLLQSSQIRISHSPLKIPQQDENFESSAFTFTSTGPSTSTNQNILPTSPVSPPEPSRPPSTSSSDSSDVEVFVSAQSFNQPIFKNKRNLSTQRDEIIDKSIEKLFTSITALSNYLIHAKSSESEIVNDEEEVLIGRLVANKLKKLKGEEKKEAIKRIYAILL